MIHSKTLTLIHYCSECQVCATFQMAFKVNPFDGIIAQNRLVIIMAKISKTKKAGENIVVFNRKAKHNYFLEKHFEAGLVLEGWEVKSLRAGRVQISESYVIFKHNEAYLIGALITPLTSASTHIQPDAARTRKLLLHKKELNTLLGSIDKKGNTVVAVSLYWKQNRIKVDIALATGKKEYDKRASIKERDWQREKARLMK